MLYHISSNPIVYHRRVMQARSAYTEAHVCRNICAKYKVKALKSI